MGTGHREQRTRSCAGRTAAHRRLAAADPARPRCHRAGDVAADHDLRCRGSPGHRARRCTEVPCAQSGFAALAAARRPRGLRRTARQPAARRGVDGVVVAARSATASATLDEQGLAAGPGACPSPGADRPRTAGTAGRAAPALRRDQEAQIVLLGRSAQPGAGGTAWPAARDRRGTSRTATHPDRPGRRRATPIRWSGNCCQRLRRRRDRLAWRRTGYIARLRPQLRCAPTSGEPPRWTTTATACAWRSAIRATWKRSNSPLSTACRRGQDRSRSGSPRSSVNFADVLAALGRQPSSRRASCRVGHRLRRRGHRGRAGCHRASGR